MTTLTKLRIHICPVGFEVDRIVQSAIDLRAERVWLIIEQNKSLEKASKFIKQVVTLLKKEKIETKTKGVTRDNLFDNLRAIKDIFVEEEKNEIHVNVSSGSKIQAIASMMACMMFREYEPKPYYVEPKKYESDKVEKPQSYGVKRIFLLPEYRIQKPERRLVKALKLISDNGGKITKKKLTELCIAHDIIDVSKKDKEIDTGDFAKLETHVIKKLKDSWHYINVERIGRNQVISITESGINSLLFLSHDESD